MKKTMTWLIMAIIAIGLFIPGQLSAERFKGEDVTIVSELPPQMLNYRLYVGTTGSTSIYYKVSAVVTGVGETRASAVLTVSDANAVLSSTNTLQLYWPRVRDATSYNVYKSTVGASTYFYLLGNVAQGTYVLNDYGQTVGAAYSAPTVVGGNLIAENTITANALDIADGVDIDGALTAATVTSDAGVTATTIVAGSSASFTNEVAAATGDFSGAVDIDGALTAATVASDAGITAVTSVAGATADFSSTGDFDGALTVASLVSEGNVAGTTAAFSSNVTVGGFFQFYSRSQSEIEAITPTVVGQAYFCNDCTVTAICVSSAAVVGSWSSPADIAVACD